MKKIIHTAIFGQYDLLKKPQVITPGWEYICYTNNEKLKSDIWKIVLVPFLCVKEVRRCKILIPHEYDLSVWVDGSIEINCNLDDFIKKYHKNSFTLLKHPHRNCVYEEATACMQRKKDQPHIIMGQISVYQNNRYPINNGMVATGLLIRNNDEKIKSFCEKWWKEVEKYSKRDQLSFNYTLHNYPVKVNLITFEVLDREFILLPHLKNNGHG